MKKSLFLVQKSPFKIEMLKSSLEERSLALNPEGFFPS